MTSRWFAFALLATLLGMVRAGEPSDALFTLVDSAGKEHKLTGVKLTAGVRRLAFLADPKGATDDAKRGPMALAVREQNSTTFSNGVLTLIPLGCVENVKYDYDKLAMTVAVNGQDAVPGTLAFRGINVLSLEAKAGDVAAKFGGGVPKDGFKSLTWPNAKPLASRAVGTAWHVQIEQPKAMDPTLTVRNLKALHSFAGGYEMLSDTLPVRKGESFKLDTKLKKLELVAVDPNTQNSAMEVTLEGNPEKLVAVPLTLEQGKRLGTLIGFVGEVDAGWKLFPLHCVKVIKPAN
jgi:hypothetical protein